MKCKCDFCTDIKNWDDGWCSCCGNVQSAEPVDEGDMWVCEACEKLLAEVPE